MINDVKVGADIEVFIREKSTNEIVTAEGLIRGTKDVPYNFDKENPFYVTSLDNIMAEFGIPPATTPMEFYLGIQKALNFINNSIPNQLETVALPAAFVDEKYLITENSKLFGCEPDFNAWTESVNPAPGTGGNLRTCGGHIHIGYKKPNPFLNLSIIKAMDIFIGVPSIIMEEDNERKTMYGKAGAFRHKKYGVEYRTVSNFYLQSQELTNWVYYNTLQAIDFVNRGGCNSLGLEEKEEIVNTINYNNKASAYALIEKFNINYLQ